MKIEGWAHAVNRWYQQGTTHAMVSRSGVAVSVCRRCRKIAKEEA